MKNKTFTLLAGLAITLGVASPSWAGALADVAGLFGTVTAVIIDVPEGILVNSLYRLPVSTTKSLAKNFGDEKGVSQNLVGAAIGVPTGIVWGIPYGAIQGARHGWTTGWDKPFSTESFLVTSEEK